MHSRGFTSPAGGIPEKDEDRPAVVFWTDRLFKRPIFPHWAPTAFAGREQIEAERTIYYHKQPPQIPYPLAVKFEDRIALEGYRVERENPLRLTLYWRKLKPNAQEYKMTLRVLNEQGQVVSQLDRLPYEGFYPISAWPVDVLLPETVDLPNLNIHFSGHYTLLLGLYHPPVQELLAVDNNFRPDHLVSLSLYP